MPSPTSDSHSHHLAVIAELSRPNPAQIDDALLGGGHNFAADRRAAARLLDADPTTAVRLLARRRLLRGATSLALELGIRQFIHLGCGIPLPWGIHTALGDDLAARIVYVDHDPVVVELVRRVLSGNPAVGVVEADATVLHAASLGRLHHHRLMRDLIDPDQPVLVLSSQRVRGTPIPASASDEPQNAICHGWGSYADHRGL